MAACLIALFVFVGDENWKAILAGIIVSMIGALAFGLARFFGEKEEIHHRHPKLAAAEAEKEAALMQAIDIDPVLSDTMLAQMEAEKEQWLKEIKEHELDWEHYDPKRAGKSGLQTAAGFLCGGLLICLIIYLFWLTLRLPSLGLPTGVLLFYGFGWYKGRLLGRNAMRSGIIHLATGFVVLIAVWVLVLLLYINDMRVTEALEYHDMMP